MSRHRLIAEDSLFMIIDIQDNLMKAMDLAAKVYANTQLLLITCQKTGIPVVVTEQYPKGLGHTVAEVANNLGEHTTYEKTSFTALAGEVAGGLQGLKRKQIIIAGSETHICVFQTVRDLLESGFEVFVLADAVCSRTKDNYKIGLSLMREEGAVITSTETVIFDLLKKAGTPEFKGISPLLK
jgi:nicotinamidase-related amidase